MDRKLGLLERHWEVELNSFINEIIKKGKKKEERRERKKSGP